MNSLVSIKLAQVLTLRDKLLLDWFAILMLLVLFFFSSNSRINQTGNLRSMQKPPLEWPACRVPDKVIMYINNLSAL